MIHNLTELASYLRALDNSSESKLGFDMVRTDICAHLSHHPCGKACCVGGHVFLVNGKNLGEEMADKIHEISENVSLDSCFDLCYPYDLPSTWEATPEQAARAVEILRDTGKCDWALAMSEVKE